MADFEPCLFDHFDADLFTTSVDCSFRLAGRSRRRFDDSFQLIPPHDIKYTSVLDLLESGRLIRICAPMVRLSKLAFRNLVREYGCDVAYSPMIMADSFATSEKARLSEFTTNTADRPLIVQFAANNNVDLVRATEFVYKECDGIDINCGCPQRWALQENYGARLMSQPELVADMVKTLRRTISSSHFSVSVKIRIHKEERKTVDFCQQMEQAGASYVTVHARTKDERNQPAHHDVTRLIKQSLSIPVVANGDVKSMIDARLIQELTAVNGVMSARGILSNPALFTGCKETPLHCVQRFVELATETNLNRQLIHRHLMEMLNPSQTKPERLAFNQLYHLSDIFTYLSDKYHIQLPLTTSSSLISANDGGPVLSAADIS